MSLAQPRAAENIVALLQSFGGQMMITPSSFIVHPSSLVRRDIHLVGIGGIGLSAIARVLIARGVQVSGSDLNASSMTDELAKLGAKIFIGHRAENVGDVDLVLITSAAQADNPGSCRSETARDSHR